MKADSCCCRVLSNTQVSGSINSLAGLTGVTQLYLRCVACACLCETAWMMLYTKSSTDCSISTNSLRIVQKRKSRVEADCVVTRYLDGTKVSGSIDNLGNLTKLTIL